MHDDQSQIIIESGRESLDSSTRGSPASVDDSRCQSEVSGIVSDRLPLDVEPDWLDGPTRAPAALMNEAFGSTLVDEMVSVCPEMDTQDSYIQAEASMLSRYHCDRFCLCQCHQVTNLATPNHLGMLLGRLYIGYNGLPFLSNRTCNVVTCRHERSQTRIRITYLFPFWFALRQLALTITRASTNFMCTLNFPVVTQSGSPMIVHTALGSIEDVRGLLATDAAVLNAIDVVSGKSPLHVGTRARNCDGESDEHLDRLHFNVGRLI